MYVIVHSTVFLFFAKKKKKYDRSNDFLYYFLWIIFGVKPTKARKRLLVVAIFFEKKKTPETFFDVRHKRRPESPDLPFQFQENWPSCNRLLDPWQSWWTTMRTAGELTLDITHFRRFFLFIVEQALVRLVYSQHYCSLIELYYCMTDASCDVLNHKRTRSDMSA